MLLKRGPAIHLETDGRSDIQIVLLRDNGTDQRFPKRTAAEELIAVMDRDYSAYRKEITKLVEEHPLIVQWPDVAQSDYEEFVAEAVLLPSVLMDTDPVAFFVISARLDAALRIADDGTAAFFLESAKRMLRILEEPIEAQVRLRNIFEIAFDDFERGTQRDRFSAVEETYPGLLDRFFYIRLIPKEGGLTPLGKRWAYSPIGLYELYVMELSLYFQQDAQRIARCENCWNYFIPKTKKETLYCDRVLDGVSCKKAGPNWKRKVGPEMDGALKTYNQLRARMMERLNRYMTAAEENREGLFPMNAVQYGEWIDMAHSARTAYLSGETSAEEFLRKIDIYNDLESHEAEKNTAIYSVDTAWRQHFRTDINFDPTKAYTTMMILDLSKQDGPARWQYRSVEEQIKSARGGQESLRQKYGKKNDQ